MMWETMITVFLQKYCAAQGLRSGTLATYQRSLRQLEEWIAIKHVGGKAPGDVTMQDVLDYVEYLRVKRHVADATVNAQVATLRSFYRALVAMQLIEPRQNPTTMLRMKAAKQKVPDTLSPDEAERLIRGPRGDTILGLRDRAILALLYGTGIRASECAHMKEGDVDLAAKQIRVLGKGGHERSLPIDGVLCQVLMNYRKARGPVNPDHPFLQTRKRRGASRGVIYQRVLCFTRRAGIHKRVTPHVLRHTFATLMIRLGEKLVVLQELLGHRAITSTQRYIHLTGEDLRKAMSRHPIGNLAKSLSDVLPIGKLRLQWPHGTRFAFNSD